MISCVILIYFLAYKVIKKKKNIDELNDIFKECNEANIRSHVRVINYSDTTITLECSNSSIASIVKFNREQYLKIFKDMGCTIFKILKLDSNSFSSLCKQDGGFFFILNNDFFPCALIID